MCGNTQSLFPCLKIEASLELSNFDLYHCPISLEIYRNVIFKLFFVLLFYMIRCLKSGKLDRELFIYLIFFKKYMEGLRKVAKLMSSLQTSVKFSAKSTTDYV